MDVVVALGESLAFLPLRFQVFRRAFVPISYFKEVLEEAFGRPQMLVVVVMRMRLCAVIQFVRDIVVSTTLQLEARVYDLSRIT